MKSDAIFYRVFQQAPSSYFELIGAAPETAAGYKFTAEELKHASRRLDGLFVPARAGPPIHFVEVFAYKTPHAYSNLFAKVFLWLETNNPAQDWRACVIFASRSLEPSQLAPYRELLDSDRVKRVYLDELPEPAEDQFGLGILQIIACPTEQTIAKAKTWLQRVRKTQRPVDNRRALVELIAVVVQSRFPKLGREELERMLELTDIRETKVFQEALEEGMEKGMEKALERVALRSLAKGYSVADVSDLTGLSVPHVKRLKKKSNSKD